MTSAGQQNQSLLSIERVVAFVVGPIVVAGSGVLSAWLSTKIGVHVSGPEITGTFAAGGVGAAGLVYKWLHGRQLDASLRADMAKFAGIIPPGLLSEAKALAPEAMGQSSPGHMEKLAESDLHALAVKVAAKIATFSKPGPGPVEYEAKATVAPPTIEPAANDPAPATPVQQQVQASPPSPSDAATEAPPVS